MLLRSKVQEMILRRRYNRSMNAGVRHAADSSSTTPCDGGVAAAPPLPRATFGSPRLLLLHSSSLPAARRGCTPASETTMPMPTPGAASMSSSPTSVLDASSTLVDDGGSKRPWYDGCAGLADALDDDDAVSTTTRAVVKTLVRSCSLERVEFGVKNKSSWVPLRVKEKEMEMMEMEPTSEDYTCVISRGTNPRTVHIFGDRVVEGAR